MALCQKFGRLLIGAEARFSARTDVTNISTSLDQLPAPTQIPAWLPYNEPKPFTLFTKEQLTGQRGGGPETFKILSIKWKNLSEDEKRNYSERAKKIGDELRDNFEKLTNRQKKDLWDKHVEKRNKLQRLQMKKKLHKFYAETNRPKHPLTSYSVFMQKCFDKQTEPIKTRDKVKKFVAEMAQQWRQMTDTEKQPYVDQTQGNIAAYHIEMAEWKQKYSNEIRAWKEATAKAARKARDTQFTEASFFEWNIDDDKDVEKEEAIQQILLDDSTHLVEKRTEQRRRQRRRRSSHSAHIHAWLPSGYNAPNACSLFMKDQMTGQRGGPEILKLLSIKWKNLSEDEKRNYSERAKKIGDELRDNFEKLTNRQKKDLWDKHVEKRNKLQRLQMKKKLHKAALEEMLPELPMPLSRPICLHRAQLDNEQMANFATWQ
uniref:HMG box domain-containing protein n=1 Tax=Globodera pallida TaxID=36090 RepID=A0A183BJ83_GLOPA